MKKKFILTFLATCLTTCALGGVACGKETNNSSDSVIETPALELAENKIEMILGETKQISVLSLEKGETVSYLSNDETVVTVSADGVIEGKKVGSAVVKATTSTGRSALAQITVYDPEFYPIPYISVTQDSYAKCVGDSFTIDYSITYLGQSLTDVVSITCDNPSVIVVEGNTLKAVGVGVANVQLSVNSTYGAAVRMVTVTVSEEQVEFYPSFLGKDIYVGRPIELAMYVNVDGVVSKVDEASFAVKNTALADIEGGMLIPVAGGDTEIISTVEYEGKTYSKEIPVHIYGYNTCAFVFADGTVDHVEQAFFGDAIPLVLENALGNPEYNKEIKSWYVNGESVNGEFFIMPDNDVEVSVRFINETEDDFTSRFTAGHLNSDMQAKAQFVNEPFVDAKGVSSDLGGYVRFGDNNFASLCYNFDTPVVVNAYATVKLGVYMPADALLLYFGYATSEPWSKENPTKRYVASAGEHGKTEGVPLCVIPTDEWTTIEMPLSAFVNEIGDPLNGISIAVASGAIYIDYIIVDMGLAGLDTNYMDNLLYQDVILAEGGSMDQEEAIKAYYRWTAGLTDEQKECEAHQTNSSKLHALVEEMAQEFFAVSQDTDTLLKAIASYKKWSNGLTDEQKATAIHQSNEEKVSQLAAENFAPQEIKEVLINDPMVDTSKGAVDQGERIQSGWGGHHADYKTAYTQYIHMTQFASAPNDGSFTLSAMNYSQYSEVYFGLYAIVAQPTGSNGEGIITIAGKSFTFDHQKGHSFKVMIKDGVLTMSDDSKDNVDGGATLIEVTLPENVLTGKTGLVIDFQFNAWAQAEVTEMHTTYLKAWVYDEAIANNPIGWGTTGTRVNQFVTEYNATSQKTFDEGCGFKGDAAIVAVNYNAYDEVYFGLHAIAGARSWTPYDGDNGIITINGVSYEIDPNNANYFFKIIIKDGVLSMIVEKANNVGSGTEVLRVALSEEVLSGKEQLVISFTFGGAWSQAEITELHGVIGVN